MPNGRTIRKNSPQSEESILPPQVYSSQACELSRTTALVVFTVTMFVSAALLFLMEPMFAKMVLPLLGGTAAVWNTCLVFFQTVLLGGCAYAHASVKLLSRRGAAGLHLALLLAALLVLPFRIPHGWLPPAQHNPVSWLLLLLSTGVGLPFFAISASTPLLQNWFSHSGHHSAADPYFLYAASNCGSLLGLLAYPLLLEPGLRLGQQSRVWAWCYGLLLLLVLGCAGLVWRAPYKPTSGSGLRTDTTQNSTNQVHGRINRWERFRWVALAFVPSSLMLGVTSALTTETVAIPLLWVLPLSLYLLSFTLAFARRPVLSHEWLIRRLPFLILAASITIITKAILPLYVLIPIDLLTLFAVAMVCHGEIARSRPSARHLTEFYLWLSTGGALGGAFNALIAPLLFSSLAEFPLALVLAAALRPSIDVMKSTSRDRKLDFVMPIALGLCVAATILALQAKGLKPGRTLNILIFGYSMVWCLSFGKRPLRFALGVAALILASHVYTGPFGHILHTERSFYGVYRITDDDTNRFRVLFHGGTSHGMQSLDKSRACEPLAYYSRDGPIGSVFAAYRGDAVHREVAIIGLGAGSMAPYQMPGQQFTFYEIDPLVERIARDPHYFTFISGCAPQVRVVLGDARLALSDAPDQRYGIIVLDAFSGDSIPLHLVTRDALRLYVRKLAPRGVLAFHITNLYLNLQPVLGNLAHDAGLVCLVNDDMGVSENDIKNGKFPSIWAVMARQQGDLVTLAHEPRWKQLGASADARAWTDDFSNIVSIIKLH